MESEEFFSYDGLFSFGPSYSDCTSDSLFSLDDFVKDDTSAQIQSEETP
ncbi:hypothetical protein [Methylocaldum sp.]|nr:hypothetical protein [Methylocaldum sp.]HYE37512.1 hypothetical protein [Methylocaldum sp.]